MCQGPVLYLILNCSDQWPMSKVGCPFVGVEEFSDGKVDTVINWVKFFSDLNRNWNSRYEYPDPQGSLGVSSVFFYCVYFVHYVFHHHSWLPTYGVDFRDSFFKNLCFTHPVCFVQIPTVFLPGFTYPLLTEGFPVSRTLISFHPFTLFPTLRPSTPLSTNCQRYKKDSIPMLTKVSLNPVPHQMVSLLADHISNTPTLVFRRPCTYTTSRPTPGSTPTSGITPPRMRSEET